MSGAFKNFKVGSHPQKFQTTKALPAYLHYFGREYDPLVDPPYPSEEALYSDTKEFIDKISENEYKNSKGALEDCSQAFGPSALGYKRPCTVNKVEAGSYTKAKDEFQLNKILGKTVGTMASIVQLAQAKERHCIQTSNFHPLASRSMKNKQRANFMLLMINGLRLNQ